MSGDPTATACIAVPDEDHYTTAPNFALIVDAVEGGFDVDWNKAKCDNETKVNKVIVGKISLFTLKRCLICVIKVAQKRSHHYLEIALLNVSTCLVR